MFLLRIACDEVIYI